MMLVRLFPVLVMFLAFLGTETTEARLGSLHKRRRSIKDLLGSDQSSITFSVTEANHHPLLFLEDSPAHSLSHKNRRDVKRTPIINAQVRTDVADLVTDFQYAIQAMNQHENDIHVGRLLLACERLEGTMRKIGFSQGAKDIGGNIRKIRNLYNRAPLSQRDSMPDLLRYEIAIGVHDEPNGTRRIKDPSAAVGFLWLGRTLKYQYDMFRLMLDENEDPYQAARRAYDQDLKPHHSWAVQKACQAAMVTLKPMKKRAVLSSLGGFSEDAFGEQENEATYRDMHQMMDCWKPLLTRWKRVFSDLELGESI